MSLFGGTPQAATQTVASGVDIQSSCYGGVVPVIYGRARLTGNLLWYGDFQAIAVKSSSGGKGGSENSGSGSYDYKASFIFALGEGPLADVQTVWASKSMTPFADSHLAFATGDPGQTPWGYLTTKYPAQALAYAGTGYVYVSAYDLGSSAQLPNLGYEVTGLFPGAVSGLPDADPKDVVIDVLTNGRYGVGFPAARLDSLSVFSSYCRATGMVISPVFDTQSDAASALNKIVRDCNSEFVWSGRTLTVVPYGDQSVTANGATYTAPSAPLYSLNDNDFLDTGDGDPVQCSRKRPSDAWNSIKLEWLNRSNQYNAEIVEAKDQAAIEAYGLRADQPSQSHQFCNLSAATMAATLKLQRQAVRNVYSFTLGWRYCLLDPMDIVEITDPGLGLANQWVRILSLEEDENGNIAVTAEEYLDGTGAAPLYSYAAGSPYAADFNVPPGPVNAPLIFEPPPVMLSARSITAPQIMIGASGGANWGGCDVWLSLDGSTYKRMGRISVPARQGLLLNTLASGSDPDVTHTLSVDLGESRGNMLSGTSADADTFRTLCYVDGELIAYETAALTGAHQYGLTYLRRGVYGSTVAAHAAGTPFCRLDDAVASFDLPVTPVSYVGQTLHLKFLSFNIYGGGQEQLADVSPYTYNPNGQAVFVYPPSGVGFTVGAEQQKDGSWLSYGVVSWTASPDPLFDQYEVQYRLHAGPGPWISWRGGPGTTSFRISPLPANTAYDVQVRAVRNPGGPFYSAWAQNLNVTTVGKTAAPPAPTSPSCAGGYRQITLDWVASAENDIAWYEVYESADNVRAHASRIALINGTHYVRPGLNLTDTRYYWVRAQDTSGNFSNYLGPVSATTLGVDAADITGQIVAGQIAANAITASNLISGLNVVQVVFAIGSANPATSNVAYETNTSKIYRWNGSSWTTAVAGSDITANSVTASQIAGGTITAAQIQAGGITGSNIAGGTITGTNIAGTTITAANLVAGTITGDKINANFLQGYDFIASGGGSAFAQLKGAQFTSSGLTYGPYFAVVDGAGAVRTIVGQWAGQYGLHVWNSTGTKILDAGDLGVNVVGTTNLVVNSATVPATATMGASMYGAGYASFATALTASVTLNDAGTLQVVAGFGQNYSGGTPPIWFLRLYVDGGVIYTIGGGSFTGTPSIIWAGGVGAGSHTVRIDWAADTNGSLDEGTLCVAGLIR
jgi:hypothetical protein